MIHNLTPHDVVLLDNAGEVIRTFKSEGVARAKQETVECGFIEDVRIVRMSFGEPVGLPAVEEGQYYIVSAMTVASAKQYGRSVCDLLLTADAVRDESGRIIGCKALALAD